MSQYGKLLAQHLANDLGKSVKEVTASLDKFTLSGSTTAKDNKDKNKNNNNDKEPEIAKKTIPAPKAATVTKDTKVSKPKGKDA